MTERFGEYLLTLFAQVGGGRGGPENDLVRFGLGVLLWGVLLLFAVRRLREEQIPHEMLLAWGFAVGLLREALMFLAVSLEVAGVLPLAALDPYLPPLEHALAMAAVGMVTSGFLRGALGARGGGPLFLAAGPGGALLLLLVAATGLAGPAPGSVRAAWWEWGFHLATAALLAWALVLLARARGWVRTTLSAAVGCFLLEEVLISADLAAADAHRELLGPVRHVLHLLGIALLAHLYLRQLRAERDEALSDLQTVINLTEGERLRTEAILDAIGDAVSVQDPEFRILYQNRVHRALMGSHRGERCYRAYAGCGSPCPGCPVALAFVDGGVHRLERPRVVDGVNTGVVEVTASCLRDAEGRIAAGIEVARDVTDRVAAAGELRRAKEELERQNAELRSLDAVKDGLIRDVTHEFKTPVAKHAMQLELLRGIVRAHGLERETQRVLDVMGAAITRQQRMIHSILDLARLEAGGHRYRLAPLRLDEVVAEVLEDRAYALEAHAVVVRCTVPPLALRSDPEMLHCLFSNLVDNAIKYRLPGAAASLEIGAAGEEGAVVVRVADNGRGFSPGQLERAFERFWQASASAEGSGVGLTICRMIAEDLGGSIGIASAGAGCGSTVTVRLPADPPSRCAQEARGAARAAGVLHPPAHPPRPSPEHAARLPLPARPEP